MTAAATAKILDGARVAEDIKHEVAARVVQLREMHNVQPCLAVVRVGEDPASVVYVGNKVRTSEALGLRSELHVLPAETTTEQLLALIEQLNQRDDVDGLLVQLPLPPSINATRALDAVSALKDVDGLHPLNAGKLSLGEPLLVPCTPAGIVELLERSQIPISGARAVIVGRSNIVGKPMAQLLLQRDATVTICHSRTKDLPAVTREADILVAAIGRPAFIRGEHIKPGATVVDVGMSKITDAAQAADLFGDDAARRSKIIEQKGATLIGDVHPAEALRVAGFFTPVPGGVGPLTVAMLMKNTITAALLRRGLMLPS